MFTIFVWNRHGQMTEFLRYNGSAVDALAFVTKLRGRGYWVQSQEDFCAQRSLDATKDSSRMAREACSQYLIYHEQ